MGSIWGLGGEIRPHRALPERGGHTAPPGTPCQALSPCFPSKQAVKLSAATPARGRSHSGRRERNESHLPGGQVGRGHPVPSPMYRDGPAATQGDVPRITGLAGLCESLANAELSKLAPHLLQSPHIFAHSSIHPKKCLCPPKPLKQTLGPPRCSPPELGCKGPGCCRGAGGFWDSVTTAVGTEEVGKPMGKGHFFKRKTVHLSVQ